MECSFKKRILSGCTTTVSSMTDGQEEPFIPSVESISRTLTLSLQLFILYLRKDGYTGAIDEQFIDNSLPNPFSSKHLVLTSRTDKALKFSALTTFAQQTMYDVSGFNVNDQVELLLKPGYYKLDGSTFPCNITINGTGLNKSNIYGKEQTGTSAGSG